MKGRISLLAVLAGVSALIALPGGASSKVITATLSSQQLRLVGTSGNDTVTVKIVPGIADPTKNFYEIYDAAGIDEVPTGCFRKTTTPPDTTIHCPVESVKDIILDSREGNDTITLADDVTAGLDANGGDGNDTANGGDGGDAFAGEAGRDHFDGGGGGDEFSGGFGGDAGDGGDGADTLSGGPGGDNLRGGPGGDKESGGPGKDKLIGGPGHDRLFGGPDADIVNCGPGPDLGVGGPGRDLGRNCETVRH